MDQFAEKRKWQDFQIFFGLNHGIYGMLFMGMGKIGGMMKEYTNLRWNKQLHLEMLKLKYQCIANKKEFGNMSLELHLEISASQCC